MAKANKITNRLAITGVLASALAFAPLAPAQAHGGGHYHGGHGDGLFFGLAAVAGAAVALATLPFRAIDEAVAPPPAYYAAPAPIYYAPAYSPVYSGYAQPVYQPQPTVVYRYAAPAYGYAYPAPAYAYPPQ